MAAARDLTIDQGDDYAHTVTFVDADDAPIDVSARSFESQIRRHPRALDVLATFTIDTTDADTGVIILRLDAADTAALDHGASWDLQQTAAGVTTTVMRGDVVLEHEVTR